MNLHALENDDIQDLYRELILDHARTPRHFGRLDDATHSAQGINPLCGDKLSLYLRVDDDGTIAASTFEGSGCAISIASASLLTETVLGLPVDQAEAAFKSVTARLTATTINPDTEIDAALQARVAKLRALDGVREFPSRVKCATLAWHALHSALGGDAKTATTE
ncbi:MAG: SUF system NifU family Fe-S cluster assembly protein [Gammaproteobacteria bacterium]|nr:SUF system NifU family Fe-S cluster assembly protein [Gammaproteobacteria bacterium]